MPLLYFREDKQCPRCMQTIATWKHRQADLILLLSLLFGGMALGYALRVLLSASMTWIG